MPLQPQARLFGQALDRGIVRREQVLRRGAGARGLHFLVEQLREAEVGLPLHELIERGPRLVDVTGVEILDRREQLDLGMRIGRGGQGRNQHRERQAAGADQGQRHLQRVYSRLMRQSLPVLASSSTFVDRLVSVSDW
jgi:hypothetical protein